MEGMEEMEEGGMEGEERGKCTHLQLLENLFQVSETTLKTDTKLPVT